MIEQLKPTDPAYNDVHVMPDLSWYEDPMRHVMETTCWCQPGIETDAVTGGRIVIHRRDIDGPLYEDAVLPHGGDTQ